MDASVFSKCKLHILVPPAQKPKVIDGGMVMPHPHHHRSPARTADLSTVHGFVLAAFHLNSPGKAPALVTNETNTKAAQPKGGHRVLVLKIMISSGVGWQAHLHVCSLFTPVHMPCGACWTVTDLRRHVARLLSLGILWQRANLGCSLSCDLYLCCWQSLLAQYLQTVGKAAQNSCPPSCKDPVDQVGTGYLESSSMHVQKGNPFINVGLGCLAARPDSGSSQFSHPAPVAWTPAWTSAAPHPEFQS